MSQRPLCFVLMPFGRKPDVTGRTIAFDQVYEDLIRPAIADAGLEALRADEEMVGGIIHKPMYERLLLCDYAVADLTLANANVYYELGVRHAVRPFSTVLLFADGFRLPFDLGPMRALPYALGDDGRPSAVDRDAKALAGLLEQAREGATDSPLCQLLPDYRPPEVAHLKTDVFRDRARYAAGRKRQLAVARKEGAESVTAVERELGDLARVEAGVLIDLLLSYRAVKAWERMIDLVGRFPEPVRRTILVREQLAFALNRAGRGDEAERELRAVLEEHGPSSETYGLLGRVYKDRWEEARKEGQEAKARGLLEQAADAYRLGFEADWRDAYPGINAVTLMELMEPPDPKRKELQPLVVYAAKRRIAESGGDYWDWATLLEAQVLARDEEGAQGALGKALARVRETWEAETTARNLRLIREARERRGDAEVWLESVEHSLDEAARD